MGIGTLGSMVVKLSLESAAYTKGLQQGSQESQKFADIAHRNFDKAGSAVKGYVSTSVAGLASSVIAFAGVSSTFDRLSSSIDSMDKVSELAEKLSMSSATLQEYAYAGQLSGIAMEDMATGLKKLQSNMLESITGGKEQAAVFKAMGVSVTDASGNMRSAEDVMGDIADVFAGLENGATKTALAVKVFGRSGAELVPFLNQGRSGIKDLTDEANKLGIVMGKEALKAAADFNDQLDRMSALSKASFSNLAASAVPALNDVMLRFLEASKVADGFFERLGLAGGITFERAKGMSYHEQIEDANKSIELMRKKIASQKVLPSWMQTADQGDIDEIERRKKVLQAMQARIALAGDPAENEDRFDRMNRPRANASAIAKSLRDSKDDGGKEKVSDYERLTRSINEKNAADEKQLALGRPLTDSERELSKIVSDRATKSIKLTDAEFAKLKAQLAVQSSLDQSIERNKQLAAIEKERADSAQKDIAASFDAVEKARQEVDTYGMLPSAISAVTAAKLQQRKASLELSGEALPQEIAHIEALIVANERLAALQGSKERLDAGKKFTEEAAAERKRAADEAAADAQRVGDEMERSLTDGLMNGFSHGKRGGDILIDYLKAQFAKTVLSPVIRPLVDQGNAAISKLLGIAANALIGGGVGIGPGAGSGATASFNDAGSMVGGGGLGLTSGGGLGFKMGPPRAGGGDVNPFSVQRVAELGPEMLTSGGNDYLLMGSQGGHVTPNSQLGGGNSAPIINVTQNIHIDSRTDNAQIRQLLQQTVAVTKAEISNEVKRGSNLYAKN